MKQDRKRKVIEGLITEHEPDPASGCFSLPEQDHPAFAYAQTMRFLGRHYGYLCEAVRALRRFGTAKEFSQKAAAFVKESQFFCRLLSQQLNESSTWEPEDFRTLRKACMPEFKRVVAKLRAYEDELKKKGWELKAYSGGISLFPKAVKGKKNAYNELIEYLYSKHKDAYEAKTDDYGRNPKGLRELIAHHLKPFISDKTLLCTNQYIDKRVRQKAPMSQAIDNMLNMEDY